MKTRHCTISTLASFALALVPCTTGAQPAYEPYTFTTIAGGGGKISPDQTNSAQRLWVPSGVAADGSGNLYVGDQFNYALRKVTPAGEVTTLAGLAGAPGSSDGAGIAARFNSPFGTAVNSAGEIYVADGGNYTIRKVTPAGVVTTFAGSAGHPGAADGLGTNAQFGAGTIGGPLFLAVDTNGTVYVGDNGNHTIRKVTPDGMVTTLAGLAGHPGSADGVGSQARFSQPRGVAVDSAGNVFVADTDNQTIRKVTPAGVVTTLAGSVGNAGSSNGTGSGARFNGPDGIAIDSGGNLYVGDYGNGTIRKVTPTGVVTTLAGQPGLAGSLDGTGGAARFNSTFAIAVDSSTNIYVADTFNNTIRKVTSAGVVAVFAGLGGSLGSADATGIAARFRGPSAVAVDKASNAYVADQVNHTIRKVTSAGVVTTLAGLAGNAGSLNGTGSAARFNTPSGVAVDSAGNVYVADLYNCTIRKVTAAGVVTILAGQTGNHGSADGPGSAAQFFFPTGVAAGTNGNVYVADCLNSTIRKVTPAGQVTTLAGSAGIYGAADGTGSAAHFNLPTAVAVDDASNVYVADFSNATIRKVTPAGVVSTLAGLAGNPGSADGTGSGARFSAPFGLAVDNAGNVYVADTFNSTIRKVTPAGVVTTLAGLVGTVGSADGTGNAARFDSPNGIAVDSTGNLYVADFYLNTIRKGSPAFVLVNLGFSGGQFSFDVAGPAAPGAVVEASTDLMTWVPIWTNTPAAPLHFTDPQSPSHPTRIYRAHAP